MLDPANMYLSLRKCVYLSCSRGLLSFVLEGYCRQAYGYLCLCVSLVALQGYACKFLQKAL